MSQILPSRTPNATRVQPKLGQLACCELTPRTPDLRYAMGGSAARARGRRSWEALLCAAIVLFSTLANDAMGDARGGDSIVPPIPSCRPSTSRRARRLSRGAPRARDDDAPETMRLPSEEARPQTQVWRPRCEFATCKLSQQFRLHSRCVWGTRGKNLRHASPKVPNVDACLAFETCVSISVHRDTHLIPASP